MCFGAWRRLLNGKVLDDNGGGFMSDVENGIQWAADNGAQGDQHEPGRTRALLGERAGRGRLRLEPWRGAGGFGRQLGDLGRSVAGQLHQRDRCGLDGPG